MSHCFQAGLGLLACGSLVASGDALARNSYCCNDAAGRLVCGDMLPAACQGRAYRIKDEKGRLVREVAAPLSAEQRKLREAEMERKREEDKRLAEQKRRDMAMLATYPSEKDIDAARDRALAEFDKGSADLQKRHAAALKRKKALDGEKEFFQKKPMPANLKRQIDDNAADLQKLQEALDNRNKEGDVLRAKYEEEKKRYIELRSGRASRAAAEPAPAAAPASSTARVKHGTTVTDGASAKK